MIDYTWQIQNLEVQKSLNDLQNVVLTISWTLFGREGSVLSKISGSTQLSAPNTSEFIPYDQLDHNTLLSWITANTDVEVLKTQIAQEVDALKSQGTFLVDYRVRPQTTATDIPLDELKQKKIQYLQQKCMFDIGTGATSNALGRVVKYPCTVVEQITIARCAQFGGMITCTENDKKTWIFHTVEQAQMVLETVHNHIDSCYTKLKNLSDAVDLADTPAALETITW